MNPYLQFNGQCEAAFNFYAQSIGGEVIEFHRYAGSPMAGEATESQQQCVMHATLRLADGSLLMGSDALGQAYEGIKGVTLSLAYDSISEAQRVFDALAVNGTIQMPLAKTFWAEAFGMLLDQFGTPWMVNVEGSTQA